MNCLEFRREILAQPLRPSSDASAHVVSCAECRAFLERQRELDSQLFDMLRVPVPDGLADRVLVAQGIRHRAARWSWAIAATVLLTASAAFLATPFVSGNALAHEAIAHVAEEPQSFRIRTRNSAAILPTELAAQGVRLAAALGEITYTQLCPMANGIARHIVVATANGPVTLFLIPGDADRRRRSVVESGGMTAISLPASQGSIAIVAASREHALAIEKALVLS